MARTTYDEIPYDGQARYHAHPDRLATLAILMGMTPAPLDRCRILEIGCGTGGNLIPLAVGLPGSQFVGIDYAPGHIQSAREITQQLSIRNTSWHACDIRQVGPDFGEFDYILCHGVFSWVPEDVQEHILFLCKRLLAPAGVAYVSYNTYPGWHLRGLVREAVKYHVRDIDDPHARVPQARAFLRFLVESTPLPDSAFSRVLREEHERWLDAVDHYLFHDLLEEVNQPLYFHQFASRAAAKGLQYLGEAWQHSHVSDLSPQTVQVLRQISGDLIQREQYLDFLRNRTFRRSLLVHGNCTLDRRVSVERLASLRISALARPAALPEGADVNLARFQTDEGTDLSTDSPLIKAMLVCLFEVAPASLTFAELLEKIRESIPGGSELENLTGRLAETLVQLFLTNLVGLHAHVPALAQADVQFPRADALARLQASRGPLVTNLRHGTVRLSDLERRLVQLSDGTRDRTLLAGELLAAARAGELNLTKSGQNVTEPDQQRDVVEREVEEGLLRLARAALLMGQ